ncbi:MAG TPA: hypothetical protein VMW56_00940 [Candidatus Margulisiibacteriota bacterium]|nr:hypothetical protein [Candidatus Margulisiibacteriota bacterium]
MKRMAIVMTVSCMLTVLGRVCPSVAQFGRAALADDQGDDGDDDDDGDQGSEHVISTVPA